MLKIINDEYFKIAREKQEYFFKDTKKEKSSAHRKQKIIKNSVDTILKNFVYEIFMMKECLRIDSHSKNEEKLHLMKF